MEVQSERHGRRRRAGGGREIHLDHTAVIPGTPFASRERRHGPDVGGLQDRLSLRSVRRRDRHDRVGLEGPLFTATSATTSMPLTGHAHGIGIEEKGIGKGQGGCLRLAPTSKSAAAPAVAASTSMSTSTTPGIPTENHTEQRRPGRLHPGDDVSRGGLRFRQRNRRLRPRHVDMAPQDVG